MAMTNDLRDLPVVRVVELLVVGVAK